MAIENKHFLSYKEDKAVPVTFDNLRVSLALLSMESWMVTLVKVENGYKFLVHPTYKFEAPLVLRAEKSRHLRVFKTLEPAANVARRLGFKAIRIEL